jgi:carbamoyl-phosphate synthase large subunit
MKKLNVLVTSSGGIVAQGIIKSLKYFNKYTKDNDYYYNIIGSDIVYEASGLYRVDKAAIIKKPEDDTYIETILELAKENNIHAIFVGSDVELQILSLNKKRIEEETNAKILTNPLNVVEVCRDKYRTFEFLKENNLNFIPSTLEEDLPEFYKEHRFPLVVKPCQGFGSQLFSIVKDNKELDFAISAIKNYGWKPLIQKYLKNDDKEFTVGITVDSKSEYVMSSISIKKLLKHGQTYKAIIKNYPRIRKVSEMIAKKIGGTGALNIQLRIDEDDQLPKVIEINPRFSATCPMRTVAGINEPDIVTRNFVSGEEIRKFDYKPLLCLRYWNETYIDLEPFEKIKNNKEKVFELKSLVVDYF